MGLEDFLFYVFKQRGGGLKYLYRVSQDLLHYMNVSTAVGCLCLSVIES